MLPFYGKNIFVSYPNDDSEFTLLFVDERRVNITGKLGLLKVEETGVIYTTHLITPTVFLLSWFEPIGNIYTTLILNVENKKVVSTVINLSNQPTSYILEGEYHEEQEVSILASRGSPINEFKDAFVEWTKNFPVPSVIPEDFLGPGI